MGKIVKLVPKFKTAKDIQRLIDNSNPQVIHIRQGIFNLQVCCPKELSQEEVEAGAGPSGTDTGWTVDSKMDNPVQCASDSNRWHWLLDA